jgi:hypothetical protein
MNSLDHTKYLSKSREQRLMNPCEKSHFGILDFFDGNLFLLLPNNAVIISPTLSPFYNKSQQTFPHQVLYFKKHRDFVVISPTSKKF